MSDESFPTGYVPPSQRDADQMALSMATFAKAPAFARIGELPPEALNVKLQHKLFGKALWFFQQLTGSCVGTGGKKAYLDAAVGDAAVRGDREECKPSFGYDTYGIGRRLGGLRGRGDGSFGAAQAEAVGQYGMLPWDHPKVPKPTVRDNWVVYTEKVEYDYSWPPSWPVSEATLKPDADKAQILTITVINNTDDAAQLAAQGYGITLASMFGLRSVSEPRVNGGFLMASWTGSWAHQMSCGGYATHPTLGRIWWIQNQWGDVHGRCPFMDALGVNGGFWITDATFGKIINSSDGEVIGHSNTEGFPARLLDWGNVGIG